MKIASGLTALFCVTVLSLTGCAPPPAVPQPFSGPVAHLEVTARSQTLNSENYVFIQAINGGDYYDPGSDVTYLQIKKDDTVYTTFDIPAGQPVTLSLSGHSVFSAPIFCIADPDYAISGSVIFTPVAGKTYIAKGSFTPSESEILIEDMDTSTVLGKVEADGSALISTSKKLLGSQTTCPLNHVDF